MSIFTFAQGVIDTNTLPSTPGDSTTVATIIELVFVSLAAVALLVITIAGFMYIIAQGDSEKTAKAKNTILYAVIGLIVSVSAYIIVNFTLGRLK